MRMKAADLRMDWKYNVVSLLVVTCRFSIIDWLIINMLIKSVRDADKTAKMCTLYAYYCEYFCCLNVFYFLFILNFDKFD